MAFARDVFTATASQTDFTISFPYLSEDDVFVFVDGVAQTEGSSSDYTFSDATTIQFTAGLTEGDVVVLQRKTSQSSRLTNYTAGALTEADLDNDSLQAFYMAQEAVDVANTAMILGSDNQWDGQSLRITAVATPTASTDAVTKAYADAIAILSGNVPTPDDPGDDGKALVAGSATFDWEVVLTDVVDDVTPQLGGDLDVNSQSIVSVSNGNIPLTPHGTGEVRPGKTNFQDADVLRANLLDTSYDVNDIGDTSGADFAVNYTLGHVVTATISTDGVTITFTNWPAGYGAVVLFLTDGGSQTITWPVAVSNDPTGLTSSGVDKLLIESPDSGTTFYVTVLGRNI